MLVMVSMGFLCKKTPVGKKTTLLPCLSKKTRQGHVGKKEIIESDSYRMGKQKNKNNGDSKDERN